MKYIKDYREGDRVFDIYLCKHKQSAVTKNGKPYENVILQDKTGTMDAKIWDPNSAGIAEFDTLDYIEVYGDVNSFQGALQVNVKRVRLCQEGEYDPADYLPVSNRNRDEMYKELLGLIGKTENPYLRKLLESFFVEDEAFVKALQKHLEDLNLESDFAISSLDIPGLVLRILGKTAEDNRRVIYACADYFRQEIHGLTPLNLRKNDMRR